MNYCIKIFDEEPRTISSLINNDETLLAYEGKDIKTISDILDKLSPLVKNEIHPHRTVKLINSNELDNLKRSCERLSRAIKLIDKDSKVDEILFSMVNKDNAIGFLIEFLDENNCTLMEGECIRKSIIYMFDLRDNWVIINNK